MKFTELIFALSKFFPNGGDVEDNDDDDFHKYETWRKKWVILSDLFEWYWIVFSSSVERIMKKDRDWLSIWKEIAILEMKKWLIGKNISIKSALKWWGKCWLKSYIRRIFFSNCRCNHQVVHFPLELNNQFQSKRHMQTQECSE